MKDLVVIGAGGFGREVLDVVDAINATDPFRWNLVGVVDDEPSPFNLERLMRRGVPYLGPIDDLLAGVAGTRYVVGIGDPKVRRRVAERCDAADWAPTSLLHPGATIGSQVTIGSGTVICAGARVTTNIQLGRHVHLNPNVTVGHDTLLGDFVSVNPAASVSGDCVIEDGVLIGVGAVVLNQLRIGRDSVVGASACVVGDVAPGTVVKGVPAR